MLFTELLCIIGLGYMTVGHQNISPEKPLGTAGHSARMAAILHCVPKKTCDHTSDDKLK